MTGASFTIAKEVRSEFGNEFVIDEQSCLEQRFCFLTRMKQLEINCT